MAGKTVEQQLKELEKRIEKIEANIPKCPECGFLLMGCELGGI
jgi:hypothetical protein